MKKYGLNYLPSYNTLLTSEIGQQLEKEGLNFLAYTDAVKMIKETLEKDLKKKVIENNLTQDQPPFTMKEEIKPNAKDIREKIVEILKKTYSEKKAAELTNNFNIEFNIKDAWTKDTVKLDIENQRIISDQKRYFPKITENAIKLLRLNHETFDLLTILDKFLLEKERRKIKAFNPYQIEVIIPEIELKTKITIESQKEEKHGKK
jgi:hypothetical protein